MKKKLILISGPSCVGKGPLMASLKEFHPEIEFGEIPVIKSWGSRNNKPRPDEKDIWENKDYFMPDSDFEGLDKNKYGTGKCRKYPQAIDLEKISNSPEKLLIMEVYYTIAQNLKSKVEILKDIDVQSIFISPISKDDITCLEACGINVDEYIVNMMIRKQLHRLIYMNENKSNSSCLKKLQMCLNFKSNNYIELKDLNDIKERVEDAPKEIQWMIQETKEPQKKSGHKDYSFSTIVCKDGEGHPNWNRKPDGNFLNNPSGDAAKTLQELVNIITTCDHE